MFQVKQKRTTVTLTKQEEEKIQKVQAVLHEILISKGFVGSYSESNTIMYVFNRGFRAMEENGEFDDVYGPSNSIQTKKEK